MNNLHGEDMVEVAIKEHTKEEGVRFSRIEALRGIGHIYRRRWFDQGDVGGNEEVSDDGNVGAGGSQHDDMERRA